MIYSKRKLTATVQIFVYISSFVSPSPEIFKVKETFLIVEKILRKDGRIHVEEFVSQHLGQQSSEEKTKNYVVVYKCRVKVKCPCMF